MIFSGENWQFRVSAWLSLAGIFSFPWRFGLLFNLKICDILFFASAFFLVWSLLAYRQSIIGWGAKRVIARLLVLLMAGILIGSLVGSVWSIIFYSVWPLYLAPILMEYARMAFTFGLFWLLFYLSLRSGDFVRVALVAIIISPIPLWISRIPALHDAFFQGDERLRGPGGDPNYLGSWIAVALLVSAAAFLFRSDKKGLWAGLTIVGTFPFLLWTGSRGAAVAAFFSCMMLGIYYLMTNRAIAVKVKKACLLLFAFVAGTALAFIAAPPVLDQTIVFRFVRPYFHPKIFEITTVSSTPLVPAPKVPLVGIEKTSLIPVTSLSDTGGSDRLQLLTGATRLSIRSPLGFGPLYNNWRPVAFTAMGSQLPAHEIFLETALRAGWAGLTCLLIILFLVARGMVRALRNADWRVAAVFGSFVAMVVMSLSVDTLTLRWFWVVVAFAVALGHDKEIAPLI